MKRFERHDLKRPGRKPLTGNQLEEGNLPGTDTYDDGLDERGRLVRPGSTTTESGGTYMEDTGPVNDGVHRMEVEFFEGVEGMTTIDGSKEGVDIIDDAEMWLMENDPEHPKYTGKS